MTIFGGGAACCLAIWGFFCGVYFSVAFINNAPSFSLAKSGHGIISKVPQHPKEGIVVCDSTNSGAEPEGIGQSNEAESQQQSDIKHPLAALREAQVAGGAVFGPVTYPELGQQEEEGVTLDDVLVRVDGPSLAASGSTPRAFDQCHWGVLELRGEDRLRFLHGQCTNALETARPGMVLDATVVTATGRTVDLVRAAVLPDRVLLLCSPNRKRRLAATFEKFIFPADRVTVSEVTNLAVFTLAGEGDSVERVLRSMRLEKVPAPGTFGPWTQTDGRKALVLGGAGLGPDLPGATVLCPAPAAPRLWAALGWWAALAGEDAWQEARVLAGRPFPGRELTPDWNALEAGLFHTVHFNKGCYIGQETLAKVNAAGKLKAELWGVAFPAGADVREGDALGTADGKARHRSDELPEFGCVYSDSEV